MTAPDPLRDTVRERLAFLPGTVVLEAEHLQATDGRLFAETFTAERAASLRADALLADALLADALLAERLDAFAARFARLQYTGHRGRVGSVIVRRLQARGYNNLLTPGHADFSLLDLRAVNALLANADCRAS